MGYLKSSPKPLEQCVTQNIEYLGIGYLTSFPNC